MEQLLKLLSFNPSTTAPDGSLAQIGSVFSSPPWIIDSGTSDHMTNLLKLFQTYVPCPNNQKIRITDGSFLPITGKVSVPISKNITLKLVLHVPKLACNLLSISKLCQDSNYYLIFFYSHCKVLDLRTGKIIGSTRMEDGLSYFDEKDFLE